MEFLSYLISGVSLGSVYAIIALGYTMVYGIAKMLNFAHGDVIMVGGYISLLSMSALGLPWVGGRAAGDTGLHGARHRHRGPGLPPAARGAQPGRADNGHRRQLTSCKNAAQLLWGANPPVLYRPSSAAPCSSLAAG